MRAVLVSPLRPSRDSDSQVKSGCSHPIRDGCPRPLILTLPQLANNISQNSDSSYLNYLSKTNNTFDLSPTNYSKVFKILSKLCKTKATGLDKIPARFLKECLDLITASLCSIFNRSITSGIFPEEWKCAKVTPLFKNGQRSDLNNYRPISVTPIVAKVSERIIYDQLYAYLNDNNLISC